VEAGTTEEVVESANMLVNLGELKRIKYSELEWAGDHAY